MTASRYNRTGGPHFSFTRDEVQEMNLAFAKAMLDARKAGLEHFTIGTIVDTSPWYMAKKFTPEPTQSFMTSSAALCMDLADSTEQIPEHGIAAWGGAVR